MVRGAGRCPHRDGDTVHNREGRADSRESRSHPRKCQEAMGRQADWQRADMIFKALTGGGRRMTKILAIEGTSIRKEIESCHSTILASMTTAEFTTPVVSQKKRT